MSDCQNRRPALPGSIGHSEEYERRRYWRKLPDPDELLLFNRPHRKRAKRTTPPPS